MSAPVIAPVRVIVTASNDPVLVQVKQLRRSLSFIVWTRVVLQAIGTGFASFWLLTQLHRYAAGRGLAQSVPRNAAVVLASVLAAIVLSTLVRRHGSLSALRTALWIEERRSAGYALVTWIEQWTMGRAQSEWLAQRIASTAADTLAYARSRIAPFARSHLAGPALFAIGAGTLLLLLSPFETLEVGREGRAPITGRIVTLKSDRPFAAWTVRVVPPAYTGLPAQTLGNASSLHALSGSAITVVGTDATPDSVRMRIVTDSAARARAVAVQPQPNGWQFAITAVEYPAELRVERGTHARLLLVEGRADSIPRVILLRPARDSVLREPVGRVPLVAVLQDDIGLRRAAFEVVVSSGEGEQFTVRNLTLGARTYDAALGRAASRTDTLNATLDIGSLNLKAGDILHVRAVARDGHPLASREAGTSETRAFRIARPSEYDSVAVEPAPPPEVDKSLMSQRMLLMLTERLQQRRPKLPAATVQDESRKLAKDQARLRQAVGDAVFQRLTGDAGGEHSHFAGDGHEHGVDEVDGKLGMSGMNAQGMLEEGDDAPVLAINKPLLEAYNAMWDAGRALEQTELPSAMVFMKQALDAIERARSAQRLYLRGKPPTVIIDIAKVRLTGKDTGTTSARAARPTLPNRLAAKEARLLRAGDLLQHDVLAARDSLAILRLESLQDAPVFAQALASLLDVINASVGTRVRASSVATGTTASSIGVVNITEPFLQARRVLGSIERVPTNAWSRGGPP